MSQGPSLQGQIVINTKSVDQAIRSVTQLEKNVQRAFGGGSKAASDFGRSLEQQIGAYRKLSQTTSSYQNIIAKAANTVANYESAVRKSNIAESKKQALIKAASAELKGFSQAVMEGATSGKALQNVNTQLSVSLGQLKRDLSATTKAEQEKARVAEQMEKAQIRNEKAMSTASQQYARAAAAIKQSGLAESEKITLTRSLEAQHQRLNATLSKTGATVRQVSSAQNKYKEALNQVNIATRNSNMSAAATQTNAYAREMRNLSTSVVVALGPLSGVAARLTALTTLFNRNAASIATVLASITGLSVLFSRAANAAQEAEKQMFRINAQLEILGETAQVTGEELNEMAHQIAAGTLLSAKEVRDASGALIEFGGIGRSQFANVTKVAQGMSVVFGGNLRGNIRKLGRAIDEPVEGLQRLERYGIILDDTTKELIESLSAQGRTFEATNILLKETVSLQKAAEAEAKGLAGAYDTVSGNLDRMYENLFISSGAAEELAESVLDVANAIAEFSKSNEAAALGQVFTRIADFAGTAFKFLIDNMNVFAGGLAFIAGSVVPKAIMAIIALSTTGFMNLAKNAIAATTAIAGYARGTKTAAGATVAFNTALKANPIMGVVSGVTALVAALWSYNSAMKAVENAGVGMNNTIIGQIEDQIVLRNDLTKSQVDGLREEVSALESVMQEQQTRYDEAEEREKKLRQAIYDRYLSERDFEKSRLANNPYVSQEQSLKNLKTLSELVTGEEREQVQALIAAIQASELYEQSMSEVNERAKELKNTIDNMRGGEETNLDLERQLRTVESLTAEYLEEEASVVKLKNALQQAKSVQEGLYASRDRAGSLQEWNSINEEISRTGRIINAIRKEMAELNDFEYSKEAIKLKEGLIEAMNAADMMNEKIGQTESQQALTDLKYEMMDLRDATIEMMRELEPREFAELANALPGVDAASGINAVTNAYVEFIRTMKEAEAEAAADNAASDKISEFYESQRTEIQALRGDYDALMADAVRLGDSSAVEDIAKAFEKEKSDMHKQGSEIATTPFSDYERLQEEYDTRKAMLEEMFGQEEQQYIEHLDKMKKDAEQRKVFMDFATGAQQASDIVGGAMEAMSIAGRESTAAYKAMAIGQAVINAALAISQTLADETLGTYTKIAMSGVIGAQAGAQIAAIQSANYAQGGYVQGKGTGTSDSISANLSNGEFVMRADVVRKIGLENLERMNLGQMPQFSSGGHVNSGGMRTSPMTSTMGSGGDRGIIVNIVDQSKGDKEYSTEESVNENGEKEMRVLIKNVVKTGINKGDYDRELGNVYDLKRKGRKR